MAEIPDVLRRAAEITKERLEDSVREDHQMPFQLLPIRNGDVRAVIYCKGRDHGLQAMPLAAVGYRADALVFAVDAYSAIWPTWEDEIGRSPDPGELERLFLAGRRDLVTEAIHINYVPIEGPACAIGHDYVRTKKRKVIWTNERQMAESDGMHVGGLVHNGMRHALNWKQRLSETIGADLLDAALQVDQSPAGAFKADLIATQGLGTLGYMVGFWSNADDEREQALFEAFKKEAAENQLGVTVLHGETVIAEVEPDIDRRGPWAQIGEVLQPVMKAERDRFHQMDVTIAARNRAERRKQGRRD